MPENTVYVGRPSKWGNPFKIGHHYKKDVNAGIPRLGLRFVWFEAYEGHQDKTFTTIKTNKEAVEWYEWYLTTWSEQMIEELKNKLRGKNLACFCKDGEPCHSDVLLKIANN